MPLHAVSLCAASNGRRPELPGHIRLSYTR